MQNNSTATTFPSSSEAFNLQSDVASKPVLYLPIITHLCADVAAVSEQEK